MPGTQLNNYDLVIEFTESSIRRVVGAAFDADNFLCNQIFSALSNLLHIPIQCPANFTVGVSLGTPTDIPIPGVHTDVIDVNIQLGDNGSIGSFRFVAVINVSHLNSPDIDLIKIDLSPGGLLYTQIRAFGINDTNNVLTTVLNQVNLIPLLPIPVNRASTSPTDIISADTRAIDDTSPQQLDALSILLLFGGGGPGNRNGFTQSFVPTNETGGIGINFDWLCRIIRPQLQNAIPGSTFVPPCNLNGSVPLSGDHNPQLDSLSLTLVDGAIQINAGVSASDTGWNATATVGGTITFEIQNGQLVLSTHIDDPNISVNLDWWVYLAAGVVGAIIGGIIGGVIGAIIGAILVPLVTWLASNLLNGLINNIAAQIVNALNSLSLNVNIPAVGVNIVFQEIHIDDIVIGSEVHPSYQAPIRSEGYLTIYNDQWVDLDNGRVGGHDLVGADLSWEGEAFLSRTLRTLCCSKLARTGSQFFDYTRYELYELYYENSATIPEIELWFPFFGPTFNVYGVETSDQRFSVVQVVEVTESYITIRYRTFEKPIVAVRIIANYKVTTEVFSLGRGIVGADIKEETARFEPALPLVAKYALPQKGVITSTKTPSAISGPRSCEEIGNLGITAPGTWKVPVTVKPSKSITFKAVTENFVQGQMHWLVNKKRLEEEKGTIKLQDKTIKYAINRNVITFETNSDKAISFEISVEVIDKNNTLITALACVQMPTQSTTYEQAIVTWSVYQKAFARAFGSLEIQSPQQVPQ